MMESTSPQEQSPLPVSSTTSSSSTNHANNIFYQEALEDVHTRFVLNVPESELETADRLMFQLEQAWWFYEDWICDRSHPDQNLPRFPSFKPFAKMMFEYSPLLPTKDFHSMWQQFSAYKRTISNYGCILLTADCKEMILCQVYKGHTLTFPAGKINHGEDGPTAAARETYEETGFDPTCTKGITAQWKETNPELVTWNTTLSEHDMLIVQEEQKTQTQQQQQQQSQQSQQGKRRICYIVVGVPKDFDFSPVCRKEVSDISWYPVDQPIPKPSFGVIPFLTQLKRWIKRYKTKGGSSTKKSSPKRRANSNKRSDSQKRGGNTTPKKSRSRNNSRGRNSRGRDSRGRVIQDSDNCDLVQAGLAMPGQIAGWSEEEMFLTNAKLIGRQCDYDGNPHVFAEQGFGNGPDPHAFRVVGGSFLNTKTDQIASAVTTTTTATSRLQPLFNARAAAAAAKAGENNDDDDLELTPFFSTDGATPWGEVVEEVKGGGGGGGSDVRTNNNNNKPNKQKQQNQQHKKKQPPTNNNNDEATTNKDKDMNVLDGIFMTDYEITQKSQAEKLAIMTQQQQQQQNNKNEYYDRQAALRRQQRQEKYQADMAFIRNWVANLPKPKPTPHFGTFTLDADAIWAYAEQSVQREQQQQQAAAAAAK